MVMWGWCTLHSVHCTLTAVPRSTLKKINQKMGSWSRKNGSSRAQEGPICDRRRCVGGMESSYHASDHASGRGAPVYKDRGSSSHGGRSHSGPLYPSTTVSGRGGLPRRNAGTTARDRERSRPRSRSRETRRNTTRHVIGMSGSPASRLRERKHLLQMQRTGARRQTLGPTDTATRVIGMDTNYMKSPSAPYVTDKLAVFPSVFPTHPSFPEEQFRCHAVRNIAFVTPLPRGFHHHWHLQYSSFRDKKVAVFDDLTRAMARIRNHAMHDGERGLLDTLSGSIATTDDSAVPSTSERAFQSYLMRHVRRLDDHTSHTWMHDLASGRRSVTDLTQAHGVPFKQWRAVPGVSKCPLLDFVVLYRPGFASATWFIRVNVVYTEMRELERDRALRTGDWFYSPRRQDRRKQGWTEKVMEYLHAIVRQGAVESSTGTNGPRATEATSKVGAGGIAASRKGAVQGRMDKVSRLRTHRDVAAGANGTTEPLPPVVSWQEKWSYVLKLSEYQFKMGLLDRPRYFDGLLSLLQKSLTPRAAPHGSSSSTRGIAVVALGVNGIMELLCLVEKLLPELLLCAETVMLLVKIVLQQLRYLLPPRDPVPVERTGHSLEEDMVVALCQLLRDVLLSGNDALVRLEENAPPLWPAYIFTDRFFHRDVYSRAAIEACIDRCEQKKREIAGRMLRLTQACPSFSARGIGPSATMRNEAQVLQTLDSFHRVDSTADLHRVYTDVFRPVLTLYPSGKPELPVDVAALFLVCEWAVTNQRPAEYRYLSALALIELHSNAVLEYGKHKGLLRQCGPKDHQLVLQSALQDFLQRYEPKGLTEVTQVIELFCLLVRRRLFDVPSFVDFARSCIEATSSTNPSPLLTLVAGSVPKSAPIVHTAYNIECAPGRGYKSSDVHLLSVSDRLKLYLWQLPRGPFPLPTCVPMLPAGSYDGEVDYLRWLEVMDLSREHLNHSKTLERAQSLCIYVFHTHGQLNDPPTVSTPGASGTTTVTGSGDYSRVLKEVEYQGKVSELVSAVKTMCGHDKGRFTRWFLHNIYEETTFFRFSDYGSVEHVVRLVCLVLEIVDVLALLEVLVHFLGHSPCFLVKNVVLPLIERHELAFCATDQIPFLLQSFVDRFHRIPTFADDKTGHVAQFFCKMYYAHVKKKDIAKLDLPFALLKPIAETARKNQDAAAAGGTMNGTANHANGSASNKTKELSLEATNPIVRIPPPREVLPPELKSALARAFKALQARAFDGPGANGRQMPTTPGAGSSTPHQSPTSLGHDTFWDTGTAFEPRYASLSWQEVVGEATASAEAKCRDSAIDFAVAAINMSMTSSCVGSTSANATRERRTPNYVFFFRAVLSEVLDKWMANLSARVKTNNKRPMTTPHYVHRCVRLIREVVAQHPDHGDEFTEKFANTLVVWLQKEVVPGFAGSEMPKRSRNPFLNADNSKEAFALNQKGRLDRVQYGLKSFLVSLVVHKVLELSQVLRLVLVPLFPRLRRASREPPPNLPTQLLAMALVFQLFSEPPQNLLLEPQKVVMFDEPLTKYHLRFLRTQVPACLMFPLCFLLCQISYQMEDNFLLRKREERGTLASATLFNLTSDGIVRDTIFHDTKEAREKHILPVYHKKQWHTAVLLTHFFRPPSSPAEDAHGQVQLLKVGQIIDQMNVWTLHRGGSIYLDLQMSRQQQKVKRSKRRSRLQQALAQKRKASPGDLSMRASKRVAVESTDSVNGVGESQNWMEEKDAMCRGHVSDPEAEGGDDELEVELEYDETSSATEILSSLIVLRTLKRTSRPQAGIGSTAVLSSSSLNVPPPCASIPTLSSSSPLVVSKQYGTPQKPGDAKPRGGSADGLKKAASSTLSCSVAAMPNTFTPCEARMLEAAREAHDVAVASLYAATVCSISRRAMGSVIAKVLQILEDDVKHTQPEKFARQLNTTSLVRLVSGIMCTTPGNAFLPRYMMSLATQLEWLYEACRLYDQQADGASAGGNKRHRTMMQRRLRCKLAVRLELVSVIGPSKHAILTICYRDRMVKTLFALLGTSTVSTGSGLSLFSWILDLIPLLHASVLDDRQFERVEALALPDDLKRRVWSVLPRPVHALGAGNSYVRHAVGDTHEFVPFDPWGVLEHVPELPSDALVPALLTPMPKRPRRVYRCVE
ncbi:hypothetical protein PsorP6_005277 [Peronosclerospora sorghi]|uniref:Uncharacterized protein n=1 Tax=Peronosclerospora sorghi TaxID=230839 RepID=A0ACC0W213_9STRA|nr:hypothetical protein PsorP6_005277 [Peronosclerospora sorghi]